MRIMDSTEVEERLFAVSDAKLHGEMCKVFSATYCKILSIFPSLEAARPRSKCGIQALCSLHVALEKAKSILQHCSECSKLYLAITGESVVLKFNKARYLLIDSLRRVEDIVPQSSGCQIFEIEDELEGIVFSLDPLEKQMGDQIIALLQQGRRVDSGHDNELESFHQAVIKLGITSSRAALAERRALKKLRERACRDEDKRKESIVSYLLHLMRKYSNLFRSELIDDIDSLGSTSTPCSPTVHGSFEAGGLAGNSHVLERQLSKLTSFNFRPSARRSGQMLLSPEELRCPISLQLMYDPVIIASGQTYERVCIENWFADGHVTCPKTQQKLAHLCLTPNYCVKGLISSWCEQNGISVPDGPPESLDLNYWRLVSSESDSSNSRSMGSLNSSKLSGVKVVPLEDSDTVKEGCKSGTENQCLQPQKATQEDEFNVFERYQDFLTVLNAEEDLQRKCKVVERVRFMLKDDEEARIFMGGNGFVEALLQFLRLAVRSRNALAQETGAMALFNLSVNNRRNKEMILAAGVIPVLETMISNGDSAGSAIALYLHLSCLKEAKSVVGSSKAVPFLVRTLESETETQCKLDALHCLYNLSSESSNIPKLLSAGIIHALLPLLALTEGYAWTEKSIAVLINLASTQAGIDETVSAPSVISGLTTVLDTGEPTEQEQAVSCLYILCSGSEKCSQMVLQEGVIPALVSISVNGTRRGKEKAQNLLMLFREQRQRDQPSPESCLQRTECNLKAMPASESKPLCKLVSKRKMGKVISFFFKSKSYSYYQC